MTTKYRLLGIAMILGAATTLGATGPAATQGRELERFLPPPAWILSDANDLGLGPVERRRLRRDMQANRRDTTTARGAVEASRRSFRAALAGDPFDRALVEARFEELLEAETALKRASLRARLDFVDALSADQRIALRDAADRAIEQRRLLRARIEEIRRRGRRLQATGNDTVTIRARMRRIERLIRSGDLEEALVRTDLLLDDLDR